MPKTSIYQSRSKTAKNWVLILLLVLGVVALTGAVALIQRTTENREKAATGRLPMAVFATSDVGPDVTNANNVLDGNSGTMWNSGGGATKWITFRLNQQELIKTIRLMPAQSPAGQTVTKIYSSINPPTSSNFGTLIYTFSGYTSDYQNLQTTLASAFPSRYLTVQTTTSPSWVAWREIEFFADGASVPAPVPVVAPSPTPSSVETKYGLTSQGTSTPLAGATSPNLAIDGNPSTLWNAGGSATRWVSVKLSNVGNVSRIKLNIAQSPAGTTTHKVYVSATAPTQGALGTLVQTFSGNTTDGQILDKSFSTPLSNVQYVTVETTQSPSWVAWREIEVYRPPQLTTAFPLPPDVAPKPGYTMIFDDEFDCPMVDNVASSCKTAFYNKWYTRYVYADGTQDYLNPQTEIQRYRDNGNHVVSNGTLKLIANRTGTYSASNPNAGIYESGMIRSKQTFTEGTYWEASLKHNKTTGTFSAFWFIPRNGAWPPEIDIVETWLFDAAASMSFARMGVRGFPSTNFLTYSHPSGSYSSSDGGYSYSPGTDFSNGFHKFGLDWTKDGRYVLYVDGVRVAEYSGPGMFDGSGNSTSPVDLILNQAVVRPNNLQFPQTLQLEADYIRVYKKN